MKKLSLAIGVSLSLSVFSQEIVSDLNFNSELFYKYKAFNNNGGQRATASSAYIFAPDTLAIPFADDFSKFHLKSYESPENFPVAYRVNRSVALTDTVYKFGFMNDTTWTYTVSSVVPNIRDTLVLRNDLLKSSELVIVWPPYNIYDTSGISIDTAFLTPDSIIEYSIFYAVKDPNALWLDNYVYLNDDYPVNKWSYGVATFDGLNQYGLPFNNNSVEAYGFADTLTSQPINLEGLENSDVVLSFLYQAQGLGNKPEEIDSLILQFRIDDERWENVWETAGSDSTLDTLEFKYVIILFEDLANQSIFCRNGFQFRFINEASITGNNDHWHLDYVHLRQKPPPYYDTQTGNPLINDVSVYNPAQTFLKNYTSMPWDHFEGYESSEQLKPVGLSWRNNYPTVPNMFNTTFTAKEVFSGDTLFQYPTFTDNPPPYVNPTKYGVGAPGYPDFVSDSFLPYSPAISDSVLFDIITSFEVVGDLTTDNNVISSPVLFKNYFAYDDGTAERAYGLEPQGLLKFACKFHLNHPDTLRAIQFYFAQVNENLSLLEFTLMVWRHIGIDGATEDTLFFQRSTPFYYAPERNGYVTYRIDPPLILDFSVIPDSSFYVGWQQEFSENIQLGLDLNTSAKQHMFYYSSGTWKKSNLTQFEKYAPMIRPVVGKELPVGSGAVENPFAKGELTLYPNPAENAINLVLPPNACRMEIFDLQGRLVKKISHPAERIDLAGLSNGLYCLRVSSNDKVWVRKFVKH